MNYLHGKLVSFLRQMQVSMESKLLRIYIARVHMQVIASSLVFHSCHQIFAECILIGGNVSLYERGKK